MDVSIRAISPMRNIKISIVDISNSIREIVKKQKTNPLGAIAIAKVTIANTLLGLELKNKEVTTSNLQTNNGSVKRIIAEYHDSKIRSYIANPDFAIDNLNPDLDPIPQIIGTDGSITVAQSTLSLEPYVSQVELTDGSIDMDYMMYLKTSNQISSFLKTVVKTNEETLEIEKAVGILIQLFPDHTEEDIDYLENTIGNSNEIAEDLLNTDDYKKLVNTIAEDVVIIGTREIIFKCSCSEEKTLDAIKMLGTDAINDIIAEGKDLEVICDFCKTQYIIPVSKIKELI